MPLPSDRLQVIFRRALKQSLVASRGGFMRARILRALAENPSNPFALAKKLAIDYKTATHHLEKLQRQHLVIRSEKAHGAVFRVTFTPDQQAVFNQWVAEWGERL